jgi:hypothetical protein
MSAGHLRQRRLGLRQPEGHLHIAIQVDGGSQGGTRRLRLAGPGVQRPEAALAVREESFTGPLFFDLLIDREAFRSNRSQVV